MVLLCSATKAGCWAAALCLAALLLAPACHGGAGSPGSRRGEGLDDNAPSAGGTDAPGANSRRQVRILFTTDEHGWLEPLTDPRAGLRRGGVVEFHDQLRRNQELASPAVVLLSAGDMWIGPYESTALRGQPMVQVFNHLGYAGAALGNHEFDFGLEALKQRRSEAKFPFLAANLRESASGTLPEWARASTLVEVGGMRLGVVGFTHHDIHGVIAPHHLRGFEFEGYEECLRREVPRLRDRGAERIVVVMHEYLSIVQRLLPVLRELGVVAVGTGHAHQSGVHLDDGETPDDPSDDVVLCDPGPYLRSYCRVDLVFEGSMLAERSVAIETVARPIEEPVVDPDPTLVRIVEDARRRTAETGDEVLVEALQPITRKDQALGQLVTDIWLDQFPGAQVAIVNAGGLRQDLAAGKVRVRDVVSVLPFDDTLLRVEVSGLELREVLANPGAIAGGVHYTYRNTPGGRIVAALMDPDGRRIPDNARLKLVVNDFVYYGGDGHKLWQFDSEPELIAADWRAPVLQYLRALRQSGGQLGVVADDRAKLED